MVVQALFQLVSFLLQLVSVLFQSTHLFLNVLDMGFQTGDLMAQLRFQLFTCRDGLVQLIPGILPLPDLMLETLFQIGLGLLEFIPVLF